MPTINDQRPLTRIGYGFDSHEFRPGIPLRIGGITLAHNLGLGGHSDGDVLLHAITDALLGAVAAPDIGALFPPSDPAWKGADSAVFLDEALKRVHSAGYAVANTDASLILAAPKIGPHAAAIRAHVAKLLNVPADCVGLKAKTPEGLNLENTAIAHVVVLLEKIQVQASHKNLAMAKKNAPKKERLREKTKMRRRKKSV
jgi:2-C-methyl-D-erythritol 2,4-cyclodiphosphate synthase